MAGTESFGGILKQRRKARDLTQAELADRVGCASSTIRMVELGERRPSKQLAELLADRLEGTADARAEFLRAARTGSPTGPGTVQGEPAAPAFRARDLPGFLTPLVGREGELAALEARLCAPEAPDGARLLTLTGPAGVGKTRLAAALAAAVQGGFADGVCFVPLAPIRDPDRALFTLAAALGLSTPGTHTGGTLLDALTQHLRGKELLLILDNMEQVIAAGPALAALLAACPLGKALVTSREPLHVRGEQVFPVPPLALPDREHFPPVAALPGYSAVALFLTRAQEAVPGFALSAGNARAIATICARMDGLPLAIELVASRVTLFSPRMLLAKLEAARGQEAFWLLGEGARDLPAHQRSLYAAIGWSYDLLSSEEQTLFVQLGVFVGGGTLPAIAAVCTTSGDRGHGVLAGVSSLLDKSLLVRAPPVDDEDEPRFQLLETLREYALAQLEARGAEDAETLRRRHADYFLALAEAAEAGIGGETQAVWVQRLARDHNDIQAALSWLLAQGAAEQAARLAGAMADFWMGHTHPEALAWILLVLEQRQHISLAVRSKVLRAAGSLAVGGGNLPLAQTLAEENLAVAYRQDDRQSIMHAQHRSGVVAAERGNISQAESLLAVSLQLARETGDVLAEARITNQLGETARAVEDYPKAKSLYEASLRLVQETRSTWLSATVLHNLGKVALGCGDPAEAVAQLRQSLLLFQELGSKGGIAYCLAALGEAAVQQDALERAVTLLAATDVLLKVTGIVLERVEQAGYETALAHARARLAPAAFHTAWDAGQHLAPDQAVAYALTC